MCVVKIEFFWYELEVIGYKIRHNLMRSFLVMGNKRNILWINLLKGICMISVYLLHSEQYTGMIWVKSYGYLLQPFYVNAFFFVSGYLLFRKWLSIDNSVMMSRESYWKSLKNLVFKLILPTIVFASVLYIPKILFNNGDVSVGEYFYDVWGGISFWFTSALLVSQIVLLTLFLLNNRNIWFYFIVSAGLFAFAYWLSRVDITPFPWYYKSGLAATLFLTLGGVYQRYELAIDKFVGKIGYVVVFIVYCVCMIWDFNTHSMRFGLMSVNINLLGFVVALLGIVMLVGVCKKLNSIKIVNYIGENSIVFYFLSGAVPATISTIFKCFFAINYFYVLLIALLSIIVSCGLCFLINRYFKFLLDLRSFM